MFLDNTICLNLTSGVHRLTSYNIWKEKYILVAVKDSITSQICTVLNMLSFVTLILLMFEILF